MAALLRFLNDPAYIQLAADPAVCHFCFGNPHDMPVPEIEQALRAWAAPRSPDWFAYQHNLPSAVDAVVRSLRGRHGIEFEPEDISLTTGAFAGLAAALLALVDPGDEVVYLSPPWFFYEPMIIAAGGRPVRVPLDPPRFDLPLDGIEEALTPATRAVIVNSPHNPSGRIYGRNELRRLGQLMEGATRRAGRPVYLISDEAYSRILFDGSSFTTPLLHYDRAILVYTYGKTLLAPGQRIGYLALPPAMPDRSAVRDAIFAAQHLVGYAFPNAVMQHALPELEEVTIDIGALQGRRDRLVRALSEMGYECIRPDATFYVLVRSPLKDDFEYVRLLSEGGVLVLPGSVFELPGWFRISLTASDAMLERALPVFERTRRRVSATA